MSSLGQTATTQALPDNSDGIQLTKFAADDILPLEYAPPIGPELVSQDQLPAAWAYKRFRDLDDKESYRRKLLQELTDALAAQGSEAAEIATAALRDLIDQMAEQGAVVLADIVESDDFGIGKTLRRTHGPGGQSQFHSPLPRPAAKPRNADRSSGQWRAGAPLMIALISYAVGGPIRMIDARGKDAEPLSVLAQDNMLHIDNTPFNDEYKILITWRRGTAQGQRDRISPSYPAPINSPAPASSTRTGRRGRVKMHRSSPPRQHPQGVRRAAPAGRSGPPNGDRGDRFRATAERCIRRWLAGASPLPHRLRKCSQLHHSGFPPRRRQSRADGQRCRGQFGCLLERAVD